ncbi:hypothetical protein [Cytobacillus firmus]|uniref:hypothetical protein n=1 Tax=Cytobacillus firmus TaxID=1399 RepID=UPI0018CFB82E|nr:hypothetical protein [Cytobacillus firmus]MBG9586321.1 hypothetical protein [Cytobacillus firmus]
MKFLVSMYVVMAIMGLVKLTNEYILNGEYSALASWLTVTLFSSGLYFLLMQGLLSPKNECWDLNPG